MSKQRPLVPLLLLTLCLLVLGVNGLLGGIVLISDPSGAGMQMPPEVIGYLPVPNFFLPGVFLFVVYGVGSLVVIYGLWARPAWGWTRAISQRIHEHWAWLGALLMALVLVGWLVVQWILMPMKHPVQPMMLTLAVVIIALDALPPMRRYYAEG